MAIEAAHVRFQHSEIRKERVEVSRLYPDDSFLLLDRDPDEWILSNPADCLSVRTLELVGPGVKKIYCVSKLHNLQRLLLCYCSYIQELPANLGGLGTLFSNLTALHLNNCISLKELPANLGELMPKLSHLDIQSTEIKWLPWSITKPSKLSLLLLPRHFRLETLPSHLNDSAVISVQDHHVHKTWREFKKEMDLFSVPIVGAEAPQFPSTPGYLSYEGDPRPWIQEKGLYSLVQILDLNLRIYRCEERISGSIVDLPMLTHLYIEDGCIRHLPVTLTKITHLSLFECEFECDIEPCFDSLGKRSTLQSLELLNCPELPAHMDLPVSLTHLTLDTYESEPLPDSYVASIRKLSNLRSLALFLYEDVDLSLLNVNLVKLKVWDCSIKSLPRGLRHLEIIDPSWPWVYPCRFDDELLLCLNHLVNLETLSVTCRKIQSFPSIEGLLNLRELHLKDCFRLRNFPPNMDKLVNLRSINVSGTRIKSLPDSITYLQNLRRLILPKCFEFESLSQNFKKKVMVSKDDTDDFYYERKGYYDSGYGSNEDSESTSGFIEEDDGGVLQESEHEINNEQASLDRPMNFIPNANQVHEENEDCVIPVAPDNHSNFHETYGHHIPNNISQQVHADPNGLGVSSENNPQAQPMVMFPSRAASSNPCLHETPYDESNVQTFQKRQRDNMEIEQWIASADSENPFHDRSNEHSLEHKLKKTQKIETLKELMSQNMTTEEVASKLKVGENNPQILGCNQEMARDCTENFADALATIPNVIIPEPTFDESNQQGSQSR